jgi:3D (Asp-Asp-Asp) domain-containing protein
MQRPLLLAVVLALTSTFPVQAKHAHARTAIVPAPSEAQASQPARAEIMASTKGSRLIAVVPKVPARPPVAKAAVVKADKPVDSSSGVANNPLFSAAGPAGAPPVPIHLARITAYYTQEDAWTAKHESSTGVRLHEGVCAVDPKLIPYGSLLQIPGMGNYVAVDTGSAVISRQAAVGSARTAAERNALVVDLFFESRAEAENFAAHGPAYAAVSWVPRSLAAANSPLNMRALPAVPTLPAGAVYVLAEAPSLADCRLPLAFRTPQLAGL